ncbi:unnamed protein product [Adineta ricciae]|uniref:LTD domain-containing protein n=1 Tax=Adineta ricciae TaxID=249248 RepID=A0A816G8M6_ADIRI|nr:unnamed protein product [Adineta ricciae]
MTNEQNETTTDGVRQSSEEKEIRVSPIIHSTNENLKKIDHSTRLKLSKSVSFSLEKTLLNQRLTKETKSENSEESILPFPSNQSELSSMNGKVLTNIRIHEIEPKNGDYLRLLNVSNSDEYDLSGHFIQQNTPSKPLCRFRFPFNTIIQPGQTITIWCGQTKDIIPQPPHIFLWKEQRKWETGSECLTILAKPNGQSIAWFRNPNSMNTDQSSSDILFVHSKSNLISPDSSSILKNSSRLSARSTRLSAFHSFSNPKSPFTHPPTNIIHPDHNGLSNDLHSQLNQRVGLSYLFPRAKSSSFTDRSINEQTTLKI